ncbi:MAG: hypothetical protein GEU28_00625 [Dehalococcoidia bacterium]|nr:hypothetical protein [Dehalococcoidia bacterium]
MGLFAIVGSIFFFGGAAFFEDDPIGDGDVIDIPEQDEVVNPDDPDATATPEVEELIQYPAPPPLALDPAVDYQAVITTAHGEVTIDLLEDEAPIAVNNFVFLAREGFYDGLSFSRVLPGFLAQAGDPTGIGTGGPGYSLDLAATPTPTPDPDASPTEEPTASPTAEPTPTTEPTPFSNEGREGQPELLRGVMAMAFDNRTGLINGSQFFIVLSESLNLPADEHVAFGRVIEGLDALEALTPRDPQANPNAPEGDEIASIEIVEA